MTEQPQFTQADVDAAIESAVERSLALQQDRHAEEMALLRSSLGPIDAAPVGTHGGGVGSTIAETWSAYDQFLANAGEHPHQQNRSAPWLIRPEDTEPVGRNLKKVKDGVTLEP